MRRDSASTVFAPKIIWDVAGRTIVANAETSYVIDVVDSGRKVASYRRAIPNRSVDRDDALAELGIGKVVTTPRGRCRIDPVEELEARGYAEVSPALDRLAVTPGGRVWARRFAFRGEEPAIDVLDATGEYLGTLPPGAPFPIAFLSEDRLLAKETDELDLEYLVMYLVNES